MTRAVLRSYGLFIPMLICALATPHTPLQAQDGAPVLRAAYVHGTAVPKPYVIDDSTVVPCLWFQTYNHNDLRPVSAPADGPTVTFSFFTVEAWARVGRDRLKVQNPDLSEATFHSQIVLTPPGITPHIQYRKAAGLGDFISKGRMITASEYYMAGLQIPTRLSTEGAPIIRPFSAADLEEIRNALPLGFACAVAVP